MLIRTLTRAAGRLQFDAGDQIELDDVEAMELVNAGCAVVIEVPKPKASVELIEQQPEVIVEKKKRK